MSACEHKNATMSRLQMYRNTWRGAEEPLECTCRDCGAPLNIYGEITVVSMKHDHGPNIEATEMVVEKVTE